VHMVGHNDCGVRKRFESAYDFGQFVPFFRRGELHYRRGGLRRWNCYGAGGIIAGAGQVGPGLVGAGSEPAPTGTVPGAMIIPYKRLGTTTAVCRNVSNWCTISGNSYRFCRGRLHHRKGGLRHWNCYGAGGHHCTGGLHRCRGGFGGADLVGTGSIGADSVGAGLEPAPTMSPPSPQCGRRTWPRVRTFWALSFIENSGGNVGNECHNMPKFLASSLIKNPPHG